MRRRGRHGRQAQDAPGARRIALLAAGPAVAVVAVIAAVAVLALRAARRRTGGPMAEPEPRTLPLHPGIADRLDALERSHAAMAAKQAAIMEALARVLRAGGVPVPAELRDGDGTGPALRCLSGGRNASLPGRAAQLPVRRVSLPVARMARYIAMNTSASSRVRPGVSAMYCSAGSS